VRVVPTEVRGSGRALCFDALRLRCTSSWALQTALCAPTAARPASNRPSDDRPQTATPSTTLGLSCREALAT